LTSSRQIHSKTTEIIRNEKPTEDEGMLKFVMKLDMNVVVQFAFYLTLICFLLLTVCPFFENVLGFVSREDDVYFDF
jgi:hypothetical protein